MQINRFGGGQAVHFGSKPESKTIDQVQNQVLAYLNKQGFPTTADYMQEPDKAISLMKMDFGGKPELLVMVTDDNNTGLLNRVVDALAKMPGAKPNESYYNNKLNIGGILVSVWNNGRMELF